jgi:hypothetical protein
MEVSGQLHVPAALPPGKEPPVPIGYATGWVPGGSVDKVAKRIIPNSCQESNPMYITYLCTII